MLILPTGLDENEVRRTPWVTWAIMAACLVVHLALSALGTDREVATRFEQTLNYLAEHPYLTPPQELHDLLGEDGRATLAEMAAEWSAEFGRLPAAVAWEQEQLNRLTRDWVVALERKPSRRLAFRPGDVDPVTLVTYTFVHGGWLHLLGNMLFMFVTGPFIEDLYGRPLYAALYVLSGVAGAAAYASGDPPAIAVLIGASGAIAGVMGAFLVRLGARRINLLVMPIPLLWAFRFHLKFPAFVVIPAWAAEQAYYASVASKDSPVAFSAHVGGIAFGVVFAIVIGLLRVEEKLINPGIERRISIAQNPDVIAAADARGAGDLDAARQLIDGVLKAEPRNVDAWTESWNLGLDAADGERASQAGLRLLELHGRGPDPDMVWSVVNEPRWRDVPMTSRFLFAVGDLLARAGDARAAIDAYRLVAAQAGPGDLAGLRALVTEGELLMRAGDERAARQAFERARSHPAFSDPWQQRIDLATAGRSRTAARGAAAPDGA